MSVKKSLIAFAGVTALSALAFAPLASVGASSSAGGVDGKAMAYPDGIDLIESSAPSLGEGLELVPCAAGMAGPFFCNNVDLVDVVPTAVFGGGHGSDSWGWTDPEDGTEYVIVTSGAGIGFFRLAEDGTAIYLGSIDRTRDRYAPVGFLWNDVKVVNNHAYITAEDPGYGVSIVDLTAVRELDGSVGPDLTELVTEVGHIEAQDGHNVVAFPERGILGVTLAEDPVCGNDLVFYDVSETPADPQLIGCIGTGQDEWVPGGTHDAQCVVYDGPDADYRGNDGPDGIAGTEDDVPASDICLMFQEGGGLLVADVSSITRDGNPDGAQMLGRFLYEGIDYAHQGWFTDDHRWAIFGDELDESGALANGANMNTTTYYIDLADLDVVRTVTGYDGPSDPAASRFDEEGLTDFGDGDDGFLIKEWNNENTIAIDHNMYIVGDLVYQANYGAGLRVLRFSDESLEAGGEGAFEEVAYFDTYPGPGPAEFYGAWNTYPFFESGMIVLSDFESGLLILDVHDSIVDPAE